MPAFASLVLDVDSTLTRIEGIEWLAERRGATIAHEVTEMTGRAMTGAVPLDQVYGKRLGLVRPSTTDVAALARAYVDAILPGAPEAVALLRARGIELTIISGGVQQAVEPLAAAFGIASERVHAVPLVFSADGAYAGFDTASPLARRCGKPTTVRALQLAHPLLALGDGSTDAELKTCKIDGALTVDAFAAFTGVASRPTVVAVADYVVDRFVDLPGIVLGQD